ncbi:hypothetical protein DFH08DRAFT_902434 [Mycena albidolilacea]|uniref:Uncharacterized protein n=1 Tax=Mycena albidolilacea TaxID=1033008 RepID=A0AAD6Z3L1_9AGAR|nr:hypothetical protein DFH08DRAFT_902434 [Mycena albidolilacea]
MVLQRNALVVLVMSLWFIACHILLSVGVFPDSRAAAYLVRSSIIVVLSLSGGVFLLFFRCL